MTVYTYGVFDLLHYGHLRALKKAKAMGDKLIIGVFTDEVATLFKRKPVMTEVERLNAIKELEWGEVRLLKTLIPDGEELEGVDIVTKAAGAGWSEDSVPELENGEAVLLPYTKGVSTSEIIKRIYDRNIK